MAKYLVTGGAGFIGSNIVEALVKLGEEVRVLDNFFTGRRENLAPVLDRIELVEGDIRDRETLSGVISDRDYVLHQAALRSVPQSVKTPIPYNEVNIGGTFNVLLAARDAGVKRAVIASSSSVYGAVERFPEKEDFLPKPVSPYAATKLAGEVYGNVFNSVYGLEVVALRYFNVFGPRQDPKSEYAAVVPKFILAMLEDKPPTVYGDGQQTRDFTYVENVVEANLQAARTPGIGGEVFNVASGRDYSVLELMRFINQILGKRIEPVFDPPRTGDLPRSLADVSKANRMLNWKVTVEFEEGLKRTLGWFRQP